MESLSSSFHTRKLSNASSFSAKHAYDGVFSGHRQKYAGAPATGVHDYREIFGSYQAASSIPVLDLSTSHGSSDDSNSKLGGSKPDYSNIFGGFRDESIAVAYEELFALDKARAPSSIRPTSQDLDNFYHQSFDALKQFNVSYHKISQRSNDGLDGATHVEQLHAVPGFTRFIDQTTPMQKMEAGKEKSSTVHSSADFNKGEFRGIQTSGKKEKTRNKFQRHESFSEGKHSETTDINLKSLSALLTSGDDHKNHPKRSTAMNSGAASRYKSEGAPGEFSSTYLDEELDVNSAAAALRKAIENAQESIRIAKESVGRKKKGLRSFSNKSFKDSLKVEQQKGKDNNVKGTFESAGATPPVFPDIERNRKHGCTAVSPDFKDGEKLSVAKKFIDEIHGKISETAKKREIPIQASHGAQEREGTSDTLEPAFSRENDTYGAPHKDEVSGHIPEGFLAPESFDEKTRDSEATTEDDKSRELKENKDELKLSNAHKLFEGPNTLIMSKRVEDEKKIRQESNQSGDHKIISGAVESFQNQKEEEVLEQEHVEKIENAQRHGKKSDDEVSEMGLHEAFQSLENENAPKDDHSTERHREEEEEVGEMFYDVCELETNESAQTYYNKIENSEEPLQYDCETNQEAHEPEIDENSSKGGTDMEENESVDSHGARNIIFGTQESCKIDINDNNLETTQEVVDVTGASDEFQEDDTEAAEEDLFEKTSIHQTPSENSEDECEVKPENLDFGQHEIQENDVHSESSSDTIQDLDVEPDKSSEEKNIIGEEKIVLVEEESSETRNTKETEASEANEEIKATQYRENVDKIRESGPSKEHGNRNDEVSDRDREREKNRLAADRAIREARERAFERATAEVRQRVMADAREKVENASVGTKSSSERSAQSKLRAERAAVERATAEARQRALEKAMSQKTNGINKSSSSSSSSSDSHTSYGTSAESAQRSKAKLENHNRIMERASKALAEKEKRDLLAQKEQVERNRLAESLDADIKRWSSGKVGNLRALLSTLQYILGAESGWQAVSLTEMITTSAVKKAYRKATLCVHPDKLQQRGASIQHKYVCEKVFDLLKAAWNRFNSEER